MSKLKDFNPEGSLLRKHQLRMLEMLDYIDGVCNNNNIPYWLSSGTLLGAVRHHGFIPWDDDVDIELLYEDYLHLLKILSETPSDQFVLQTYKTDKNYVSPYSKLRDLKSEIVEFGGENRDYKYKGVFIDIFPLEKSSVTLLKLSEKIQNKLYALVSLRTKFLKTKLCLVVIFSRFLMNLLYPFFRLFSTKTNVCRHTYGTGFYAPRDVKRIFPLQKIKFEGKSFNAPYDIDYYLRTLYGDYMKLPDIKNLPKHIKAINFF